MYEPDDVLALLREPEHAKMRALYSTAAQQGRPGMDIEMSRLAAFLKVMEGGQAYNEALNPPIPMMSNTNFMARVVQVIAKIAPSRSSPLAVMNRLQLGQMHQREGRAAKAYDAIAYDSRPWLQAPLPLCRSPLTSPCSQLGQVWLLSTDGF